MKKTILAAAICIALNTISGAYTGFSATAKAGGEMTILENGYYFNGKQFVPFKEMFLKDGKILVINSAETKVSGHRIALNGKYVIPGLTDAHEHLSGSPAFPYVMGDPELNANSNLNCGVTTVVDLFYPEAGYKAVKQDADKSPEYYSSLIMSGPILTAPGGHGTEYGIPTRTITSVADARRITKEVIEGGADVIKLVYEADASNYIPSISKDMMIAIVEVAHSRNKKVFAHIDRASQAIDCIDAKVDVLAHIPGDGLSETQLKKMKSSGIVLIPTITVLQSLFEGHDARYMSDSLLWRTANSVYLEKFNKEALAKIPIPEASLKKYYPENKFRENLANCIKMRIPIVAGTDAGNYAVFFGYSLHNEIMNYAQAGMTNADALCTATENMRLIFPGIKTGRIEAGYDADLVVLNANPIEDIRNTESINMVFHKGMVARLINTKAALPATAVAFDPSALDISKMDKLPANFTIFTDEKLGGASSIDAAIARDAMGNYLQLTGNVVKKGYVGFAGENLGFTPNLSIVDLSPYSAIEFDVKGNGEDYYFSLVSDQVKDYNFHSATFKTETDWKTVRIPFADMKQSPYYGKQIALDLKTITSVSYAALGKDGNIDMGIKNIHFVK